MTTALRLPVCVGPSPDERRAWPAVLLGLMIVVLKPAGMDLTSPAGGATPSCPLTPPPSSRRHRIPFAESSLWSDFAVRLHPIGKPGRAVSGLLVRNSRWKGAPDSLPDPHVLLLMVRCVQSAREPRCLLPMIDECTSGRRRVVRLRRPDPDIAALVMKSARGNRRSALNNASMPQSSIKGSAHDR